MDEMLNQRSPWSAAEAEAASEYFLRELRRLPTPIEFNAFVAGYRASQARKADRFG
jgi:hypothetical protein